MNLLRDEAAQAEFERDPEGMLARHGLDDLCGQDVRDVAPLVADHESVSVKDDHEPASRYYSDDDAVQEISYLKEHYEVNQTVYVDDSDEYNLTYVDDRDTLVTVDDRDTTMIVADGDVTIEDSFNQDNDVNVIEDSFNQDNDGVDNKGGVIDDSPVAGDDIEDSLNETDSSINDSGNTDSSINDSVNTTDSYSENGEAHLGDAEEEIDSTEEEPVGVA